MKVTCTFIKDESIKLLAKKQRSDSKSWGRGWRDGRYFYLSRFAKIGNFHVYMSVLPLQGLFQPIYTVLLSPSHYLFSSSAVSRWVE
jgi:hypothetical protein